MEYTRNKKRKGESHLSFLRRTSRYYVGSRWPGSTPAHEYHIIALQPGRGGVYGIVRVTDSSAGTEHQFGLVVRVETIAGDTLFKAMTEMEGPALPHMPEKLFRRLTPVDQLGLPETEQHNCREWRALCRRLIDNRNSLRPGVIFSTSKGLPFGSASSVTEFKVIDPCGRIFLANPGSSAEFRVRLSSECIDELEFTVHS